MIAYQTLSRVAKILVGSCLLAAGPYNIPAMPGSLPLPPYQQGGIGAYPVSLGSSGGTGSGMYVPGHLGLVSSGNALPIGQHQLSSSASGGSVLPSSQQYRGMCGSLCLESY